MRRVNSGVSNTVVAVIVIGGGFETPDVEIGVPSALGTSVACV